MTIINETEIQAIRSIIDHLDMAFGGRSQWGPTILAAALWGQQNNNGFLHRPSGRTAWKDGPNGPSAVQYENEFRGRLDAAIELAAELAAEEYCDQGYTVAVRAAYADIELHAGASA